MSSQHDTPILVGLEAGRKIIFGTEPGAPSKRTFAEWRARGYFPVIKVGKKIFVNAEEVRNALDRRFKINARDI